MFFYKKQDHVSWKLFSSLLLLIFLLVTIFSDLLKVKQTNAQSLGLPEPTDILYLSKDYQLPVLKGIKLDKDSPLDIEFLIDSGDLKTSKLSKRALQESTDQLVQYFLAALTVPEKDLWVNLSPYEADRVVENNLGQTELGTDLLKQDYILKQLSSSLTVPGTKIGQDYWKNNKINQLNKIWIKPQTAKIYQDGNFAFITESKLKIFSESETSDLLIEEIEREVNSGKHFANLRQIYNAIILAVWFKNATKDSFYKHYINQKKIKGIDIDDKTIKDRVYDLYCESFKKGVYDQVKVEKESKQKRKYFCGGFDARMASAVIQMDIPAFNDINDYLNGDLLSLSSALTVRQHSDLNYIISDLIGTKDDLSKKYKKKEIVDELKKLLDIVKKDGVISSSKVIADIEKMINEDSFELFFLRPKYGYNTFSSLTEDENSKPVVFNFQNHTGHNSKNAQSIENNVYIASPSYDSKTESEKYAMLLASLISLVSNDAGNQYEQALIKTYDDNFNSSKLNNLSEEIKDYINLKDSLWEAVVNDDNKEARKIYRKWVKLVEELEKPIREVSQISLFNKISSDPQLVQNGAGYIKEIYDTSESIRPQEVEAVKERVINRVVDAFIAENEREFWSNKLEDDINPQSVHALINDDFFNDDNFADKKDFILHSLEAISHLIGSEAAYMTDMKKIVVRSVDNLLLFESNLVHELIHYLADHDVIKIDAKREYPTFAGEAVYIIKRLMDEGLSIEDAEKVVAPMLNGVLANEELGQALSAKGKELWKEKGNKIFSVNIAAASDNRDYVSIDNLVEEAIDVYKSLGLDTRELGLYLAYSRRTPANEYEMQEFESVRYGVERSVSVLLRGALLQSSIESNSDPLVLLKEYLDRLANKIAIDNKEDEKWVSQLTQKIQRFAGAIFGTFVDLKFSKELDSMGFFKYSNGANGLSATLECWKNTFVPGKNPKLSKTELRKKTEDTVKGHLLLAKYRAEESPSTTFMQENEDDFSDPILKELWEFMTIPNAVYKGHKGLRKVQAKLSDKKKEQYETVPQNIKMVFESLFDFGDAEINEQVYESYPLHLQYLNTLMYIYSNFQGNKDEKFEDPRLQKDSDVEKAILETFSDGWQHLLFKTSTMTDEDILTVVKEEIYPKYKELYDKAQKIEEEKKKKEAEKLAQQMQQNPQMMQQMQQMAQQQAQQMQQQQQGGQQQNDQPQPGNQGQQSQSGSPKPGGQPQTSQNSNAQQPLGNSQQQGVSPQAKPSPQSNAMNQMIQQMAQDILDHQNQKPGDSKDGKDGKADDAKPGDSNDAKDGNADNAKPGDSNDSKDAKAGETKPGDVKDGKDGEKGEAKAGDVKDSKGSKAQDGDAKNGLAQLAPPENMDTLNNVLNGNLEPSQGTFKRKKKKAKKYDWELDPNGQLDAERELLMTGLNEEEQRIYNEWRSTLPKSLIDKAYRMLSAFLIKYLGMKRRASDDLSHEWDDVVDISMSNGGTVDIRKKRPFKVRQTFLLDRSGSMSFGDRLLWVRLIKMLFLEVFVKLNKQHEELFGWQTITYDDEIKRIMTFAQSLKIKEHQKERVIYDALNELDPRGGTDDKKAFLQGIVAHLKETLSRDDNIINMMVAVTDGNFGSNPELEQLLKLANQKGLRIYVVAVGNEKCKQDVIDTFGEERAVIADNLSELPYKLMDKFIEVLEDKTGQPIKDSQLMSSSINADEIDISKTTMNGHLKRVLNDPLEKDFYFLKGSLKERVMEVEEQVEGQFKSSPKRKVKVEKVEQLNEESFGSLFENNYFMDRDFLETMLEDNATEYLELDELATIKGKQIFEQVEGRENSYTFADDIKEADLKGLGKSKKLLELFKRFNQAKSAQQRYQAYTDKVIDKLSKDRPELSDFDIVILNNVDGNNYSKIDEKNKQIFIALEYFEMMDAAELGNNSLFEYQLRNNESWINDLKALNMSAEDILQNLIENSLDQKAQLSELQEIYENRARRVGYKHFYYQKVNGRDYLIYQNGTDEWRWERGVGMVNVPDNVTIDDDGNEALMLEMLQSMYAQGMEYTSYTRDGKFYVRSREGNGFELNMRSKDGMWPNDPYKVFNEGDNGDTVAVANGNDLSLEINETEYSISLDEALSEDVQAHYMKDLNMWAVFSSDQKRLLMLEINESGQLSVTYDMKVESEEDLKANRVLVLEGEPGLGKDELLQSTAHLMGEEVWYLTGHEDATEGDIVYRRVLTENGSEYVYSSLNYVQQNGGIVVLSEAQYIDEEAFGALKEAIASGKHDRLIKKLSDDLVAKSHEKQDRLIRKTVNNHIRARLVATTNIKREGIKIEGFNDQAILDRFTNIHFVWKTPAEEAKLQAQLVSNELKRLRPGLTKEEYEKEQQKVLDIAYGLVNVAKDLRLDFMGYNIQEKKSLKADDYSNWQEKLKDPLFHKRAVDGSGKPEMREMGKMPRRAPSPRVIRAILEYAIAFPKSWENSPWDAIEYFYNFEANKMDVKERADQLEYVKSIFAKGAYEVDDKKINFEAKDNQPEIIIRESDFKLTEDGYWEITPQAVDGQDGKKEYWDTIRVKAHPSVTGKLPKEIKKWLKTGNKQNMAILYRVLQMRALGKNIMLIGDQGTGKSVLSRGICKLLSGPDVESYNLSQATTLNKLLQTPELDQDNVVYYQYGPVARAVKESKLVFIDELTQGRPGVQAGLNEALQRGLVKLYDVMLKGAEGFGFIFAANTPGGPFKVEAPSDEFIERCVIFKLPTLPANEMHPFLTDMRGLLNKIRQVNPSIIGRKKKKLNSDGDPELDSENNFIYETITVDGREEDRYEGLVGIYQYLRHKISENPDSDLLRRVPAFRTFEILIPHIIDYWRSPRRLERKDKKFHQKQLWNLFRKYFKQAAKDYEKLYEIEKLLQEAFEQSGLWSEQPGVDAIREYLNGEDMVIEKNPYIRVPKTGDDRIDHALMYLQETNRGSSVRGFINELDSIVNETLVDSDAWLALDKTTKLESIYKAREIYQILNFILERGKGDERLNSTEDNYEAIKDIAAKIQERLVFDEGYPREFLLVGMQKDDQSEYTQSFEIFKGAIEDINIVEYSQDETIANGFNDQIIKLLVLQNTVDNLKENDKQYESAMTATQSEIVESFDEQIKPVFENQNKQKELHNVINDSKLIKSVVEVIETVNNAYIESDHVKELHANLTTKDQNSIFNQEDQALALNINANALEQELDLISSAVEIHDELKKYYDQLKKQVDNIDEIITNTLDLSTLIDKMNNVNEIDVPEVDTDLQALLERTCPFELIRSISFSNIFKLFDTFTENVGGSDTVDDFSSDIDELIFQVYEHLHQLKQVLKVIESIGIRSYEQLEIDGAIKEELRGASLDDYLQFDNLMPDYLLEEFEHNLERFSYFWNANSANNKMDALHESEYSLLTELIQNTLVKLSALSANERHRELNQQIAELFRGEIAKPILDEINKWHVANEKSSPTEQVKAHDLIEKYFLDSLPIIETIKNIIKDFKANDGVIVESKEDIADTNKVANKIIDKTNLNLAQREEKIEKLVKLYRYYIAMAIKVDNIEKVEQYQQKAEALKEQFAELVNVNQEEKLELPQFFNIRKKVVENEIEVEADVTEEIIEYPNSDKEFADLRIYAKGLGFVDINEKVGAVDVLFDSGLGDDKRTRVDNNSIKDILRKLINIDPNFLESKLSYFKPGMENVGKLAAHEDVEIRELALAVVDKYYKTYDDRGFGIWKQYFHNASIYIDKSKDYALEAFRHLQGLDLDYEFGTQRMDDDEIESLFDYYKNFVYSNVVMGDDNQKRLEHLLEKLSMSDFSSYYRFFRNIASRKDRILLWLRYDNYGRYSNQAETIHKLVYKIIEGLHKTHNLWGDHSSDELQRYVENELSDAKYDHFDQHRELLNKFFLADYSKLAQNEWLMQHLKEASNCNIYGGGLFSLDDEISRIATELLKRIETTQETKGETEETSDVTDELSDLTGYVLELKGDFGDDVDGGQRDVEKLVKQLKEQFGLNELIYVTQSAKEAFEKLGLFVEEGQITTDELIDNLTLSQFFSIDKAIQVDPEYEQDKITSQIAVKDFQQLIDANGGLANWMDKNFRNSDLPLAEFDILRSIIVEDFEFGQSQDDMSKLLSIVYDFLSHEDTAIQELAYYVFVKFSEGFPKAASMAARSLLQIEIKFNGQSLGDAFDSADNAKKESVLLLMNTLSRAELVDLFNENTLDLFLNRIRVFAIDPDSDQAEIATMAEKLIARLKEEEQLPQAKFGTRVFTDSDYINLVDVLTKIDDLSELGLASDLDPIFRKYLKELYNGYESSYKSLMQKNDFTEFIKLLKSYLGFSKYEQYEEATADPDNKYGLNHKDDNEIRKMVMQILINFQSLGVDFSIETKQLHDDIDVRRPRSLYNRKIAAFVDFLLAVDFNDLNDSYKKAIVNNILENLSYDQGDDVYQNKTVHYLAIKCLEKIKDSGYEIDYAYDHMKFILNSIVNNKVQNFSKLGYYLGCLYLQNSNDVKNDKEIMDILNQYESYSVDTDEKTNIVKHLVEKILNSSDAPKTQEPGINTLSLHRDFGDNLDSARADLEKLIKQLNGQFKQDDIISVSADAVEAFAKLGFKVNEGETTVKDLIQKFNLSRYFKLEEADLNSNNQLEEESQKTFEEYLEYIGGFEAFQHLVDTDLSTDNAYEMVLSVIDELNEKFPNKNLESFLTNTNALIVNIGYLPEKTLFLLMLNVLGVDNFSNLFSEDEISKLYSVVFNAMLSSDDTFRNLATFLYRDIDKLNPEYFSAKADAYLKETLNGMSFDAYIDAILADNQISSKDSSWFLLMSLLLLGKEKFISNDIYNSYFSKTIERLRKYSKSPNEDVAELAQKVLDKLEARDEVKLAKKIIHLSLQEDFADNTDNARRDIDKLIKQLKNRFKQDDLISVTSDATEAFAKLGINLNEGEIAVIDLIGKLTAQPVIDNSTEISEENRIKSEKSSIEMESVVDEKSIRNKLAKMTNPEVANKILMQLESDRKSEKGPAKQKSLHKYIDFHLRLSNSNAKNNVRIKILKYFLAVESKNLANYDKFDLIDWMKNIAILTIDENNQIRELAVMTVMKYYEMYKEEFNEMAQLIEKRYTGVNLEGDSLPKAIDVLKGGVWDIVPDIDEFTGFVDNGVVVKELLGISDEEFESNSWIHDIIVENGTGTLGRTDVGRDFLLLDLAEERFFEVMKQIVVHKRLVKDLDKTKVFELKSIEKVIKSLVGYDEEYRYSMLMALFDDVAPNDIYNDKSFFQKLFEKQRDSQTIYLILSLLNAERFEKIFVDDEALLEKLFSQIEEFDVKFKDIAYKLVYEKLERIAAQSDDKRKEIFWKLFKEFDPADYKTKEIANRSWNLEDRNKNFDMAKCIALMLLKNDDLIAITRFKRFDFSSTGSGMRQFNYDSIGVLIDALKHDEPIHIINLLIERLYQISSKDIGQIINNLSGANKSDLISNKSNKISQALDYQNSDMNTMLKMLFTLFLIADELVLNRKFAEGLIRFYVESNNSLCMVAFELLNKIFNTNDQNAIKLTNLLLGYNIRKKLKPSAAEIASKLKTMINDGLNDNARRKALLLLNILSEQELEEIYNEDKSLLNSIIGMDLSRTLGLTDSAHDYYLQELQSRFLQRIVKRKVPVAEDTSEVVANADQDNELEIQAETVEIAVQGELVVKSSKILPKEIVDALFDILTIQKEEYTQEAREILTNAGYDPNQIGTPGWLETLHSVVTHVNLGLTETGVESLEVSAATEQIITNDTEDLIKYDQNADYVSASQVEIPNSLSSEFLDSDYDGPYTQKFINRILKLASRGFDVDLSGGSIKLNHSFGVNNESLVINSEDNESFVLNLGLAGPDNEYKLKIIYDEFDKKWRFELSANGSRSRSLIESEEPIFDYYLDKTTKEQYVIIDDDDYFQLSTKFKTYNIAPEFIISKKDAVEKGYLILDQKKSSSSIVDDVPLSIVDFRFSTEQSEVGGIDFEGVALDVASSGLPAHIDGINWDDFSGFSFKVNKITEIKDPSIEKLTSLGY